MTETAGTKSGFVTAQDEVLRALQGIRFGSVEVIVHDSKIVQIVRKEKLFSNEKAVVVDCLLWDSGWSFDRHRLQQEWRR